MYHKINVNIHECPCLPHKNVTSFSTKHCLGKHDCEALIYCNTSPMSSLILTISYILQLVKMALLVYGKYQMVG